MGGQALIATRIKMSATVILAKMEELAPTVMEVILAVAKMDGRAIIVTKKYRKKSLISQISQISQISTTMMETKKTRKKKTRMKKTRKKKTRKKKTIKKKARKKKYRKKSLKLAHIRY